MITLFLTICFVHLGGACGDLRVDHQFKDAHTCSAYAEAVRDDVERKYTELRVQSITCGDST